MTPLKIDDPGELTVELFGVSKSLDLYTMYNAFADAYEAARKARASHLPGLVEVVQGLFPEVAGRVTPTVAGRVSERVSQIVGDLRKKDGGWPTPDSPDSTAGPPPATP